MGISPGTRNLNEAVTYWADAGTRDDFNEPTYSSPVLLSGRWIDIEQQVQNNLGEVINSTTEVIISADVGIGGYLSQGDHTSTANPHSVAAAREIQAFRSYPDLRSMTQQRKAFL